MSGMTDADIKWCMRHIEPHLKDTDAAVETLLAGVRKCIEKDARLRGEAAQQSCQFCGGTKGHWEGCRAPIESPKWASMDGALRVLVAQCNRIDGDAVRSVDGSIAIPAGAWEAFSGALGAAVGALQFKDTAQGEQQAVAWLLPSGELFTSAQMEAQRRVYGDTFGLLAEPLYTRPQPAAPAPVAGDAVVAVIADMRMYNTAGPNAVYLRTTKWIKELEAALATQHGDNT